MNFLTNSFSRIVNPAIEPVTKDELRDWARIDDETSDSVLDLLIQSTRESAEDALGYGLITQDWLYSFHRWPANRCVQLPMAAPAQSIIEVRTLDEAGTPTVVDPAVYYLNALPRPSQLIIKPGFTVIPQRNLYGIEVEYRLGFGDLASDVPGKIKLGILAWATVSHESRNPVNNMPAEALEYLSSAMIHSL